MSKKEKVRHWVVRVPLAIFMETRSETSTVKTKSTNDNERAGRVTALRVNDRAPPLRRTCYFTELSLPEKHRWAGEMPLGESCWGRRRNHTLCSCPNLSAGRRKPGVSHPRGRHTHSHESRSLGTHGVSI